MADTRKFEGLVNDYNRELAAGAEHKLPKILGEIRDELVELNALEIKEGYDNALAEANPILALIEQGFVNVSAFKLQRGTRTMQITSKMEVYDLFAFVGYIADDLHQILPAFPSEAWASNLHAFERLCVLYHRKDYACERGMDNYLANSAGDAGHFGILEVETTLDMLPALQTTVDGIVSGFTATPKHIETFVHTLRMWDKKNILSTKVTTGHRFQQNLMRILHSVVTGKHITVNV